MKKTVLFDLDGTLTDSGEGIINCATLALQHFGLPIPAYEDMRTFVGPPLRDSFIRFGVPADQADEAIRVYRSRYIPTGMFENTPYPGIRELLEALRAEGYTLYVATSKPETTAREILDHFDLSRYFDCICGANIEKNLYEKDQVIAYLLGQTQAGDLKIMVGDTKYDVIGAKAHGIPTIGVSWGYGDVEEMRAAGAAAIVDRPEELLAQLNQMANQ